MSNIVFVKHVYVQLYICTFENLINSLLNPYWQSSGAWARPNYGKFIQPKFMSTYSLFEFRVSARPISGILSKIEHLVEKWYSKNSDGWIFQKSFQLMPRKLRFQKTTGWVFQKSVCVTPRKTKISKKFLDEFTRIFQ